MSIRSRPYRYFPGRLGPSQTSAYEAHPYTEQDTSIIRYQEVAQQHRLGTPIPLLCSMPCCVSTDGLLCSRGTTVAIALPKKNGTWLLLPICEACVAELEMIIGDRRS